MEDQIKERSYKQGQVDLIAKIKQDVLKLESNVPDGFDLALDILFLLKNIKPVKQ
jgi:hypothetical protein